MNPRQQAIAKKYRIPSARAISFPDPLLLIDAFIYMEDEGYENFSALVRDALKDKIYGKPENEISVKLDKIIDAISKGKLIASPSASKDDIKELDVPALDISGGFFSE